MVFWWALVLVMSSMMSPPVHVHVHVCTSVSGGVDALQIEREAHVHVEVYVQHVHVCTSISAGVDALQIEREARHWAPYPQRLTLLAQHVTKHTVIAQPRRQLHAGEARC